MLTHVWPCVLHVCVFACLSRDTTFDCYWSSDVCLGEVIVRVFFFFQAEDGIRDLTVTGVQTCALPISLRLSADDSFNQVPVVHSLADPRLVGTTAVVLALALALGAARRRMPVLP